MVVKDTESIKKYTESIKKYTESIKKYTVTIKLYILGGKERNTNLIEYSAGNKNVICHLAEWV